VRAVARGATDAQTRIRAARDLLAAIVCALLVANSEAHRDRGPLVVVAAGA
jgi:hypothetical protein